VRAVNVGVRHENDFAVANLGGIEVVLADAAAQRRNHGADSSWQHLVVAGLFNVEDLALERQNGLEAAVAALLGGAACAFALDQIKLAAGRGCARSSQTSLPASRRRQCPFAGDVAPPLRAASRAALRLDGLVA